MSEVTKKKAAEILGVSQKEIARMIGRGELKARKKTKSKFSDFLITIPDTKKESKKVKSVIEAEIKEKKPKVEKVESSVAEVIEQEIEEKSPKEEPEEAKEDVKEKETKPELNNRTKMLRERRLEANKRKEGKHGRNGKDRWWF